MIPGVYLVHNVASASFQAGQPESAHTS
jgi:hypothetical protein